MEERIAAADLRGINAANWAQLTNCWDRQLLLACVELPAAPKLLWMQEPFADARDAGEGVPLHAVLRRIAVVERSQPAPDSGFE